MGEYNLSGMLFRIKKIKKENGITNEQLSKITGISLGTLSKILAGVTKEPAVETIIKISKALHVSADYLIFGDCPTDDNKAHSILQKYNLLNATGKAKVDEYINDLIENSKYQQQEETSNKTDIATDIIDEFKQDLAKTTINIK